LKYRRIDGVNPEGTLVTSGLVEVTPAYRTDTTQGQLTTVAQTFPVGQSITLAGGTYLFKLRASDGHGGRLKDEGVYRLVPASGTFDVDDLAEVTPTVTGTTQSDVAAMIAAAISGVVGGTPTGSGPGGAFVIQDVTDSTVVGKAVVKAVDAAAGRTAIGAAPTVSPTFTTSLTAANPVFTGTVTIPDNALAIADTSGLQTALDAKAPLASPTLTGVPVAPTATAGTNTTQVATTAFVLANAGSGAGAPLASPAFTGTPTAPTATAGTNTTQLATTAFVTTAANASGNNVVIPNATLSTARNHPVTGAVLPAAPACCVTWTTVLLATAPTAFDANGDIWFNKEA
jgi:hypothetical protein